MVEEWGKTQNFDHMPELKLWWAYPAALLAMAGSAVGMLLFFWNKGWIGKGKSDDQDLMELPEEE